MSGIVLGWAVAAAAFAAFLVILPLAIRAFGGERRLVEVVVGTALAVFAVSLWLASPGREVFWSLTALYGFLFVAFLQAFAIIYKSISLRMLVEVAGRPEKGLAADEAHRTLVIEGAYARRLAGLEKGGLVRRDGDKIRMTGKGQVTARRIAALQRFFGIESSG